LTPAATAISCHLRSAKQRSRQSPGIGHHFLDRPDADFMAIQLDHDIPAPRLFGTPQEGWSVQISILGHELRSWCDLRLNHDPDDMAHPAAKMAY